MNFTLPTTMTTTTTTTNKTLFEEKYKSYKELERTYASDMRKFMAEKNVDGIKKLLEEIAIPEENITYDLLQNSPPEIIKVLIDGKIEKDQFVTQVAEQMAWVQENDGTSDTKDVDFIEKVAKGIESKFSVDYKMYLIMRLLTAEKRSLRDVSYYYEGLICEGLHNGNVPFVNNCLSVFGKNGFTFKFDPKRKQLHEEVLGWVTFRIRQGKGSPLMGWSPKEGLVPFPQSIPINYINTLDFMKSLCDYEF